MSGFRHRGLNARYVAACAVLLVGLIAAAWTIWTTRSPPRILAARASESALGHVCSANSRSVAKHGAPAVASAARSEIQRSAVALGVINADALAEDVGDILFAWFGGTGRDYLAYLEKRGLQPPAAPQWSDPGESDISWERATKYFGDVTIDPDGIKIVERFTNGREVELRNRRFASHAWRYDKLSMLRNNATDEGIAVRAKLTVREIEVPIRMDTYSGKQFDGHLGLSYAWDKGTRAWVLVRVAIYDYPNGEAVIIPPF